MRKTSLTLGIALTTAAPAIGGTGGECGPAQLFRSEIVYGTSGSPQSVSTADMNGDGIVDLVTGQSGNLNIFYGNANGTYQPRQVIPFGGRASRAELIDIDANGTIDIASDASGDTVNVRLNNGDGTFQPEQLFPVGLNPIDITSGDFDNNGTIDIITANQGVFTKFNGYVNESVSVLLGNGDGTFQPEIRINGIDTPQLIRAADLNGDGSLDLLLLNLFANPILLRGNGDGTFQQSIPFLDATQHRSANIDDLNSDGIPDVVLSSPNGDAISIRFGSGNGAFGANTLIDVGFVPTSVLTGDLDANGTIDLCAVRNTKFRIALGNGDGTFQNWTSFDRLASGPAALADLDLDGALDLACAGSNGEFAYTVQGTGDGTFPTLLRPSIAGTARDISAADLNNDGIQDLVISNDEMSVLLGNGDGTFLPEQRYPAGNDPRASAIGDINGDAIPDIAVINQSTDDFSFFFGTGDGTFLPEQRYAIPTGFSTSITDLAFALLDNDSVLDLAVSDTNDASGRILRGSGSAFFSNWWSEGIGSNPVALAVADLNNDTLADVAFANAATDDVSVILGTGNGVFQDEFRFPAGDAPSDIQIADLNGDGQPDLAVTNINSDDISILLANGDGTFQPELRIPVGTAPRSIAITDYDNDGSPDLAVSTTGSIALVQSDQAGVFAVTQTYFTALSATSLLHADTNLDGRPDLVMVDDVVNILLNQCESTAPPCPGDCDNTGDVTFADLVATLFEFGNNTPACDADNSGTITFADLVAALFLFGPCP